MKTPTQARAHYLFALTDLIKTETALADNIYLSQNFKKINQCRVVQAPAAEPA